jgi:hypothetical protein
LGARQHSATSSNTGPELAENLLNRLLGVDAPLAQDPDGSGDRS